MPVRQGAEPVVEIPCVLQAAEAGVIAAVDKNVTVRHDEAAVLRMRVGDAHHAHAQRRGQRPLLPRAVGRRGRGRHHL